jgi:hypothetical protein
VSELERGHDHRERWLRLAAVLILIGLGIEILSLRWTHPTAFVLFAAGTGLCVGAGVVLFLATLFSTGPTPKP